MLSVLIPPTGCRFPCISVLCFVRAQCFSLIHFKGDSIRFRSPLRDSFGFSPNSLLLCCQKQMQHAFHTAVQRTGNYV